MAKEELNKACEPLRRLTPKFSPELLQMMRSETVLAKQHRYTESNEVKRRVEIRKAVELEDFNQSIAHHLQASSAANQGSTVASFTYYH